MKKRLSFSKTSNTLLSLSKYLLPFTPTRVDGFFCKKLDKSVDGACVWIAFDFAITLTFRFSKDNPILGCPFSFV